MRHAILCADGGFSEQQADAIIGSIEQKVAAGGTNQSDATQMNGDIIMVRSASGNNGLLMPSSTNTGSLYDVVTPETQVKYRPGGRLRVINRSGSTVKVYPVSGANFYGLSANVYLAVPDGCELHATYLNSDVWAYTVLNTTGVFGPYTIAGRPSASAMPAGSSIRIADSTYGLYGLMTTDGSYWTGTFSLAQTIPVIKACNVKITAAGATTSQVDFTGSGTPGKALPQTIPLAWLWLETLAGTNITQGYYLASGVSNHVFTLLSGTPGNTSSFAVTGTTADLTASTGTDVNLLALGLSTPVTTGQAIPADLLGIGGMFRTHMVVEVPSTATGNFTLRQTFGGTKFFGDISLTTAGLRGTTYFWNTGANNTNAYLAPTATSGWVEGTNPVSTSVFVSAVDTHSSAQNHTITMQNSNATDWCYLMRVWMDIRCQ